MAKAKDNRTALVTGASRRLGRIIALDLAARGWRIGVHYRSSATEAAALVAEVDRDHAVRNGETVGVAIAADRWMPWYEEQA